MISGHMLQVVDESQVVEMLDSLSLDNDEDHASVDGDSDTSGDSVDSPPLRRSNTSSSTQKVEKPSVQEVSSSDGGRSGKAVGWSNSDRFRRGLFKSCVVDFSTSGQSAKCTSREELQSGCDEKKSVETGRYTYSSCNLPKKVTEDQTTLERVKACVYEWKTTELVAFLCADPSKRTHTGVDEHENANENISSIAEVNRDVIERNTDRREETVKLYERKVGEFYGAKRRVQFADSCRQVVNFYLCFCFFLFESQQKRFWSVQQLKYTFTMQAFIVSCFIENLFIVLHFDANSSLQLFLMAGGPINE